ncbi:MAG TPA: TRAP transporter substrate-binding protein DctP [Stellaceae bacterium]|nr:TRAP transporter substrate-binding protein DctP [Stellaceae bacterium]
MKSMLIAAGLLVILARSAAADPVTLRFAPGQNAPVNQTDVANFYRLWADRVTNDSKGALKIDVREGFAIANSLNMYDRVTSDVIQIGFVLFNYVEGKFPLTEVAALPNTADNAADGSRALWRLYQSGMLDKEFDTVRPLLLVALPQSIVHLRSAPKSLEDLTGQRIVGPTQMTGLAAKYMGAQTISLPSNAAYEAINRGTADGTILSFNVYFTFKIGEVTHYHIDQPMGTAAGMIFMTRKVYDGLPADAKAALDKNSGEAASAEWGSWWDRDNATNREIAKKDASQTVVTLPPQIAASWTKRLDAADAEWMKSRPGAERALAKYKQYLADIAAGR